MCADNDHQINSIIVTAKVEGSPNGKKEYMTYALICTKCGHRFEDITEQSTADTIRSIK